MKKAILTLAVLAGPAVAQSYDTTCTQTGIFTNCNTSVEQSPNQSLNEGIASLGRALAARRQRRAEQQQAQIQELFNTRIATLIQEGSCDQASQLAIRFGRYDVVNAVTQACHSAAPAMPAPMQAPSQTMPLCGQVPRPAPCQSE